MDPSVALFLTLFLAGLTMVIDLIVLLNAYLQGEILTVGFLLKVSHGVPRCRTPDSCTSWQTFGILGA